MYQVRLGFKPWRISWGIKAQNTRDTFDIRRNGLATDSCIKAFGGFEFAEQASSVVAVLRARLFVTKEAFD